MLRRPRRITVVTGTRSEYGLLEPVMRAILQKPQLQLRLIVTGQHLTAQTHRYITEDGFTIDRKVAMQDKDRIGRRDDAIAVGRGMPAFAEDFDAYPPTFVLVLGDRIEAFAAAAAASISGFRVAHIHGGDRAEGIADEAMRHAISKLAHLHFAATAQSRDRLIHMGEPEAQVYNTGSPAIDRLTDIDPDPDAPDLIVMQHPVGEDDDLEQSWMRQTLEGVAGYRLLVMAPNDDAGAHGIRAALEQADVPVTEHLKRDAFLAKLMGCRAIVGNSSAGLIEAAALKTPCVNVGPRQAGREKPASVVDCAYGSANVAAAATQALALDLRGLRHPYGDGRTGPRIAELLADADLDKIPLHKHNSY
jgi:UDP-hydrolysing UDP-N-acetyl-D-glucosamine 2-epimerase